MKNWKWWMRGGLLVAGAPALSGCFICGGGTGGTCGKSETVKWSGNLADGGPYDGGYLTYEECQDLCPDGGFSTCDPVDAGLLRCAIQCVGGRAPPGLASLSNVDGSAGSWISRMAQLETAAVQAFAQLADELDVHGLHAHAQHARVAALDEVRHARAVTGLALRFGHCPAPLTLSGTPEPRSLEELALDNASEGCGRELYGAAVNQWQATHATEPAVRQVMGKIAAEERQHAQWSFALASTLEHRLPLAQRRRAREAQARTLARLGGEDVPRAVREPLGLMDAEEGARTAQRLLKTARL